MTDSASESQNFILQLSEDSYIENAQEFTGNNKEENDDIIVISDSSCSSSPEHCEKTEWGPDSAPKSKNKKVKYKRLYISETSSDEEEEKINLPWRLPVISDDRSSHRKYINNVQNDKAFYSSDEITATSSDMSYGRQIKKQTSKFDTKESGKNIILTPTRQGNKQFDTDKSKKPETCNVKETNKIITPSSVTSSSSSIQNRLNQCTIYSASQPSDVEKIKLTKEDTRRIFKNIISTKIGYDSPRQRKETNVIINESTDVDDDIIHPAISPIHNRANCHNDSFDVETNPKDDIIPDSQPNSLKCDQIIIDTREDEELHRPLSERKKRQIAQWLMTNQADSQNDSSSCSNIPASTRNSIDSANSSLERLEMNYETPNNRGKINEERATIVNNEEKIQVVSKQKTTVDRFIQRSKNSSEFCTPDRPMVLPKAHTDKKISSSLTVDSYENTGTKNCADILDKFYGKSWRNKANVLLPTSEPRKKPVETVVKAIQTER